MKGFFKAIKHGLFPLSYKCDICGGETFGCNVCPACARTVIVNDKTVCPLCGRKTVRPELCVECKDKPPYFKKAFSAYVYNGGTVALIKKFKNGKAYLKESFAGKICEKLKAEDYDCIVCVPMTRKALKKRSYNQGKLLARAVSVRMGVPFVKKAILKVKKTPEQKHLSREARRNNLRGCFEVVKRKDIAGKRVLVVDDVLTTGATADEMARVLINAGAREVYFATAASVEYKLPGLDKFKA